MDLEKQKILDRIAKLMTLAADQKGNAEGETAMAMASKLMAKYRISEAEIDFGSSDLSEIIEDDEGLEILKDQGGIRQWVADLGNVIGYVFDCKMYMSGWRGTLHFVGSENDVETCLYFTEVVFNHIQRGAVKMFPKPSQYQKRNQYGTAAEQVVRCRLYAMKDAMTKEERENYSGGYALVVVKTDLVNEAYAEISKGFKTAKRVETKLTDRKAWLAGQERGKSAPLNFAIGNDGTEKLN